jgi:hypothetical protein
LVHLQFLCSATLCFCVPGAATLVSHPTTWPLAASFIVAWAVVAWASFQAERSDVNGCSSAGAAWQSRFVQTARPSEPLSTAAAFEGDLAAATALPYCGCGMGGCGMGCGLWPCPAWHGSAASMAEHGFQFVSYHSRFAKFRGRLQCAGAVLNTNYYLTAAEAAKAVDRCADSMHACWQLREAGSDRRTVHAMQADLCGQGAPGAPQLPAECSRKS